MGFENALRKVLLRPGFGEGKGEFDGVEEPSVLASKAVEASAIGGFISAETSLGRLRNNKKELTTFYSILRVKRSTIVFIIIISFFSH